MWNGSISHTVTGRKCQEWVKDTPHKHNNHINNRYPEGSQKAAKSFCRDPDKDGTPWCYTVDPEKRWEYCGIPQCASRRVKFFLLCFRNFKNIAIEENDVILFLNFSLSTTYNLVENIVFTCMHILLVFIRNYPAVWLCIKYFFLYNRPLDPKGWEREGWQIAGGQPLKLPSFLKRRTYYLF